MNKAILTILVALAVISLAACSQTTPQPASNMPMQPAASPAQQPAAQPTVATSTMVSVSIKNFAFNPQTLTIDRGTTVKWTNNDDVAHKIKSDTFNSDYLNNGNTYEFTFTKSGTYPYSCAIHPSMTATITVR